MNKLIDGIVTDKDALLSAEFLGYARVGKTSTQNLPVGMVCNDPSDEDGTLS